MVIKGRKNCLYYTDWMVKLHLTNDNTHRVAEQLTLVEARKIYEELKTTLKDKTDWVEIQTEETKNSNQWEFFNKDNIVSVELLRY